MNDDVKALIARIQAEMDEYEPDTLDDDYPEFDSWKLLHDVKAALEASARAPAVDHTKLAKIIAGADEQWYDNSAKSRGWTVAAWSKHLARTIRASGVLQDADVLVRSGYDAGYTNGRYDEVDRAGGIAPSRIEFDASLAAEVLAEQDREPEGDLGREDAEPTELPPMPWPFNGDRWKPSGDALTVRAIDARLTDNEENTHE